MEELCYRRKYALLWQVIGNFSSLRRWRSRQLCLIDWLRGMSSRICVWKLFWATAIWGTEQITWFLMWETKAEEILLNFLTTYRPLTSPWNRQSDILLGTQLPQCSYFAKGKGNPSLISRILWFYFSIQKFLEKLPLSLNSSYMLVIIPQAYDLLIYIFFFFS